MSDFLPGEVARLSLTVTNAAGAAVDPGAVVLKVKPPAGAVTDYAYGVAPEISRTGAGEYFAEILLTAAGRWAYRWELAAPNAGAAEGSIVVAKSAVLG
ncbi:hypothetical protein [Rhodocyclus tenuis]|uniref:YtkA-like domain-containing protein n=1 Tax=Rhodocyclus tenuis TaxID=1066 RepID=A0A840G247_RHOTE|nr:hypothetical protein [Rhodocyclus tenuis]MBB4248374.1 hypothetical protein [Rhodocyclus tenuis]